MRPFGSKWAAAASSAATEMAQQGVHYREVTVRLQQQFPQYSFSYASVRARLIRIGARKTLTWRAETRARVVELIRQGFATAKIVEALQTEFPMHKFTVKAVNNQIQKAREKTGDATLVFNKKPPDKWTPEVVDRLRELIKTDRSAPQIAVVLTSEFPAFTFTGASICGRLHRLRAQLGDADIRSKGNKPPPVGGREPPRQRWDKWEKRNAGGLQTAIKAAKKRDVVQEGKRLARAREQMNQHRIVCCGNPVDIWGLTGCQCKWPIWADGTPFSEQRYCGNKPVTGRPYCEAHEVMSLPPRKDGQKPEYVPTPGVGNSNRQWGWAA